MPTRPNARWWLLLSILSAVDCANSKAPRDGGFPDAGKVATDGSPPADGGPADQAMGNPDLGLGPDQLLADSAVDAPTTGDRPRDVSDGDRAGPGTGGRALDGGPVDARASGGSGGASSGGVGSGGMAGHPGSGGGFGGATGTGGVPDAGGSVPPGWFDVNDWGVTMVDWHGCTWTSVTSDPRGEASTMAPVDFLDLPANGPYHITGTVLGDGSAELGFNLNESPTGDRRQCAQGANAATGLAEVTIPGQAAGLAINFVPDKPAAYRVHLRGADAATDSDQDWCALLPAEGGKLLIKWSSFFTRCWALAQPGQDPGRQYDREPLAAVAFVIPGDSQTRRVEFDLRLVGFGPGSAAVDGP